MAAENNTPPPARLSPPGRQRGTNEESSDGSHNLNASSEPSINQASSSASFVTNEINASHGKPESKKGKHKRFHRLFTNVPTDELLVCRFSCAFISGSGVLIQGHLYVSKSYIGFFSNLFGYKTTIEIPFSNVVSIHKAKTAKFFPNAVGIKTTDQYYVFGSLISRDNTYQLLTSFLERYQQQDQEADKNDGSIVDEDESLNIRNGVLDESADDDDDTFVDAVLRPSASARAGNATMRSTHSNLAAYATKKSGPYAHTQHRSLFWLLLLAIVAGFCLILTMTTIATVRQYNDALAASQRQMASSSDAFLTMHSILNSVESTVQQAQSTLRNLNNDLNLLTQLAGKRSSAKN